MLVLRKIWRALFCCYLRFEISHFPLLPTMQQIKCLLFHKIFIKIKPNLIQPRYITLTTGAQSSKIASALEKCQSNCLRDLYFRIISFDKIFQVE